MIEILNTFGLVLVVIFMVLGLLIFGAMIYGVVQLLIDEWREERKERNGK